MLSRVKVTDENCGLSLSLRLGLALGSAHRSVHYKMLTRRSKTETTEIAGCGYITTTSCNLGDLCSLSMALNACSIVCPAIISGCVSPKPNNAMAKRQFLPTIIVDNALHFPTYKKKPDWKPTLSECIELELAYSC